MAGEYTTKPLTLETLEKYNKKVLLPDIKGIVDERMQHYTNEILESNDRVIKKLKPLREVRDIHTERETHCERVNTQQTERQKH